MWASAPTVVGAWRCLAVLLVGCALRVDVGIDPYIVDSSAVDVGVDPYGGLMLIAVGVCGN
ncbi:MAG: hypothetical protein IIY02_05810 [Firmicutes bacterium]|nr:hypothetical protein [Bacillota bacterium]